MVKIGIILSKQDVEVGRFSKFSCLINEYIDDPKTHFFFSDEHPILARYLNQLQYRKCTLYHIGLSPKHTIGKFNNRGGFISYVEINATIREESEVVIN